ncbi:MAG: L,D-transpeptidase family protein, partial [Chitinophagaceae bacterium]
MKKLLTVFVSLGVVLSSCDYLQGYIKGTNASAEDSLQAKGDYMALRDRSITAENAYSDIFLDSAAVENFIQKKNIGDAEARKMRSFYNGRNYQAAWLSSTGFTEQGRGFWNMVDSVNTNIADSSTQHKNSQVLIDSLMEEDSLQVTAADSLFIQTELMLTHEFVNEARDWPVDVRQLHAFFLPAKKVDAMQLADSILNKESDSSFSQNNKMYTALKGELQRYYILAKDSSWQPLTMPSGQLKKGASSAQVAVIKKRLAATGDWASADTSHLYSDSLHAAIVSYQKRHGLDSSGAITDTMITLLNVHPLERIEQILVNMNRLMWAPVMDSGNRAVVNIPSFMLQVYDNDSLSFEMPVVVGKEGTNTLMLNGKLNEVVFNPYWNIPASIVETEIMPAMKAGPDYLKKHNMELVKEGDSIPQIRQVPGPNNALGKVKFL